MGDRRNVVVVFDDENSVALYSHWGGSDLPETLASALSRGSGRHTDPTYLTRIIFSEMVQGDVLGETGYGIEPIRTGSTMYCEASPGYDLVVNVADQTVEVEGKVYTFDGFVSAHSA